MGFRVWGLRFGVWGLGFRVWGSGFRVCDFRAGFRGVLVWALEVGGLGNTAWGVAFRVELDPGPHHLNPKP